MKEDLQVLCQTNCMVSALLYLFMFDKDHDEDSLGCMQILNTMYKMMEQTKVTE